MKLFHAMYNSEGAHLVAVSKKTMALETFQNREAVGGLVTVPGFHAGEIATGYL